MQEGINLANNDSESNAKKSPEMEDITKRFFCTWRRTGTHFENEKTYRHETICRISRRILQLNFYAHDLVFLYYFATKISKITMIIQQLDTSAYYYYNNCNEIYI